MVPRKQGVGARVDLKVSTRESLESIRRVRPVRATHPKAFEMVPGTERTLWQAL